MLARLKPDVAFNALHGRAAEDRTIQGVLEVLRIPYTHSGVMASSLAAQKDVAKVVMAAAGVPVPAGRTIQPVRGGQGACPPGPTSRKPVAGFVLRRVHHQEGRSHPPQELLAADWPYGDMMLAEKFVAGRELTCAVMGDRALGVTEIKPVSEAFYGFDAKYAKAGQFTFALHKLKEMLPTDSRVGSCGA